MKVVVLGLALLSGIAFAQAPTETAAPSQTETPPPKAKPNQEKVTVTGSHIQRLDVEEASPVSTIDNRQIEESGEVSVGDLLRKQTYNSFGSRRENSGGSASGAAYVNLRGVGEARTLVLLNGKRISRDVQNGAVDLNMLPLAAIDHIDILRDGASAIYGADALGGVVNIITKKNFDGSQYSSKFTIPEQAGGGTKEFDFTGGGTSGKTNFLNMLSYRETDSINTNQRDILRPNWQSAGAPGTYRGTKTKKYIVDPTCPADRKNQRGTSCSYDVSDDSIRKPPIRDLSLFSSFDHELNDDITLFTQFYATRKLSMWYWSPTSDERNLIIPAASRATLEAGAGRPVFAGIPAGEDIELQYRLLELGKEKKTIEATAFGVNGGLKGRIGADWTYEVSAAQDRKFEVETGTGLAVRDKLLARIADGSYNPFKPEGERGDISDLNYKPYNTRVSATKSADVTFTGPIAKMNGSDISMAVGGEVRKEEYNEEVDAETQRGNTWGTIKGNSGAGDRRADAGFLEFVIPAAEKLEVQISGRYDTYSDFGDAFSPKIAATYRPFKWLMARGSYGTGYKAPTLFEMYRNENLQYVSGYRDYSYCNKNNIAIAKCPTRNGYITQAGSTELKKEQSRSQNLGLGFAPLDGLTLNVDYWRIIMKDEIGYIDTDALLKAQAAGVNIGSFGASATVDPVTGETSNIRTVYQNLGRAELGGYDIAFDYRLKSGANTWGLHTDHSISTDSKETAYPNGPLVNKIKTYGRPAYRDRTALSYGYGPIYTSITADLIGPQNNDNANVGAYGDLNYFIKYATNWNGEFTAGVNDLLDHRIPVVNTNLYDYTGRSYEVGYKQNF